MGRSFWGRFTARIGVVAVVIGGLAIASTGANAMTKLAVRHGQGALVAPRLISLTYGRYRPRGAPHAYLALRLKAIEPNGQIVEMQFGASDGRGAIGDSGCGIGGRRNGQVEIFYTPFKLKSGVDDVTVTATGSACTSSTKTRTATRTFSIAVR